MKKLDTPTAVQRFRAIHGDTYDYSMVDYKGADVKVKIICTKHEQFEQRPHNHGKGEGCPKCKGLKTVEAHNYGQDEFLELAKKAHGDDRYDYSKTVYTRAKDPVTIICKICNKAFKQIAVTHYKGHGCPSCGAKEGRRKFKSSGKVIQMPIRVSEQSFLDTLTFPTGVSYIPGSYHGVHKPIELLCDKHGKFRMLGVTARTAKYWCSSCVSDNTSARQLHSLEIVLEKARSVHADFYSYDSEAIYEGNRTILRITCPKHGEFEQMAMPHLAGRGCRACGYDKVAMYNPASVSKGEADLCSYFKDNHDVESSNHGVLGGRELDMYFPDNKVAVEYQGLYWHREEIVGKTGHLRKHTDCSNLGVDLIQIFEDEWLNKPEIVKSIISTRLGKYEQRIYGRKTSLVEVTSANARVFYDANHIQGFVGCEEHYGLSFEGTLVAMASFSKPRKILTQSVHGLELVRFCTRLNTQVVGGLSKLLSAVKGKSILSYCDRRLFNGKGYEAAGFKLSHISAPGYYYVKGNRRFSRFKFQKHKLPQLLENYDKNKSEKDNMLAHGYSRLYDCGNLVLTLQGHSHGSKTCPGAENSS